MAITFTGSCASYNIIGNDLTTQNLFAINNLIGSRLTIKILKIDFENDTVGAYTGVMGQVKISRATGVATGTTTAKMPFDTAQTSSSSVEMIAPLLSSNIVVATEGVILTQYMQERAHTIVEQIRGLIETYDTLLDTYPIKLQAGETLLIKLTTAAVAANASSTYSYAMNIFWQEDTYSTYAINGQVTLSASPVVGAKVVIFESSDKDMANARLVEVKTTDGSGNWSSTIRTGWFGAAFVQYRNGGLYYTAPASPYLG